MADERAANEVLSFVLVFALITSTIGIVSVAGLSGLENARDAEQLRNAERAFDVLADNVEDLHEDNAPSRATEIKLADSQLQLTDAASASVEIENVGISPVSVSPETIVYTANGPSEVAYESGAVIRTDRGGGVMDATPPYLFTETDSTKTVVIPLIETRAVGSGSVGGDATVLIRTELVTNELLMAETTPGVLPTGNADSDPDNDGNTEYLVTFKIQTTPQRAPVWLRYFDEEIPASFVADGDADPGNDDICRLTTTTDTDDTVTCTVAVEEVYVTASRIDVTFA